MKAQRALLLFLPAAVSLTFACAAPAPLQTVNLPPQEDLADFSAPPALAEPRLLTLVSPAVVRLGDYAVIRLTFAPDPGGIPAPATFFADAPVFRAAIAEARLEMPGIVVHPPGTLSQPLAAGQSAVFTWRVRPQERGQARGTVWFFLRFVSREGRAETAGQVAGAESRLPVAALPVCFEVVSLVGLSGGEARLLGGAGVFLALLLAFPLLLERLREQKS